MFILGLKFKTKQLKNYAVNKIPTQLILWMSQLCKFDILIKNAFTNNEPNVVSILLL